MEQYLNLVWKNYTASLSRNSDDENLSDEQDVDTFAGSDLHYTIPFWIGVIVISLLFLSAIIATLRYCFYSLCSSRTETEKIALVPPRSPCLTSAANTIQRQRRDLHPTLVRHPSDLPEKVPLPSSSVYPDEFKDHRSNVSIVPILRQHSRPNFTPTHMLTRQHQKAIDADDIDNHHFHSTQSTRSRTSADFRKKVHGIYVLPVSPALSSSSSTTTNTDEMMKNASNTMPIRSLRHISSSVNVHNDSSCRGIKNDCFSDSPQPKDRTLPRSHAGTLRRIQPPSQPPPLPPTNSSLNFNDVQMPMNSNQNKFITTQHQSATLDLDADAIALRFTSQKIYGAIEDNQIKKAPPPPVPCRAQKPTIIPIGFEGLTTMTKPDILGFHVMPDSSPQDDYSEHTWPKPPESMTTSQISGPLPPPPPPPPLPSSIPYDRLNHDHLIPTVLMRQNSTTTFFQHHRFGEHTMLTESET